MSTGAGSTRGVQGPDNPRPSPLADLSDRHGLPDVDHLLARRAELVKEAAPLRALYGPGGTFPHARKVELSKLAALMRAMGVAQQTKLTEAAIEEAAHSHDDYAGLIARATTDATRLVIVEGEIHEIDTRISWGQSTARMISAELRL